MSQVMKDVVTWLKQWFYTEDEIDTLLGNKQDTLVSGSSIKTINNNSLLGSGDINVGGGGLSFDDIYPVGSIYMSVNSTSPQTLFGGTWVQLTDTFLYASNTADTNSTTATGGESTHTLIESELPYIEGTFPHIAYGQNKVSGHTVYTDGNVSNREGSASTTSNTHIYKFSFGNGQAHNNMPPYMKVYIWKRTA